ncbi:thiolase-like protein [Dactylonectria macrodidyma]|uniref:beta-ketoacyl-[acyl-carrier-protein] synthase I n=1 Tax=Dactylonectria macrodidyma TaxID=307937 RepID=A0A9P9ER62_9HYPO|nr:thiolase-like protein [Dactylonectria macrodidyma]
MPQPVELPKRTPLLIPSFDAPKRHMRASAAARGGGGDAADDDVQLGDEAEDTVLQDEVAVEGDAEVQGLERLALDLQQDIHGEGHAVVVVGFRQLAAAQTQAGRPLLRVEIVGVHNDLRGAAARRLGLRVDTGRVVEAGLLERHGAPDLRLHVGQVLGQAAGIVPDPERDARHRRPGQALDVRDGCGDAAGGHEGQDGIGGLQLVVGAPGVLFLVVSDSGVGGKVKKRIKQEAEDDKAALEASVPVDKPVDAAYEPQAKIRSQLPVLPERYQDQMPAGTAKLEGLLDLDSTVVVTGFAEMGSAGSPRTRWDLEAHGEFSLEGCVDGPGCIEYKSGEPIRDVDVKSKLEGRIREHTGIRIVDPDESSNVDPRLRNMLHEVGADEDLPPFECSLQAAEACRRAGTPRDTGVPEEVLTQAGRASLYVLVAVVEAFLCAGITDGYKLYRYVHVSEAFHEHRLLGQRVQSDILSKSFVGTAAAWVNLMLLSASGPLKTAAGTCATSLESLDTESDLIRSGRAKTCLASEYDIFTRPIYYEFGEMGAIINAAQNMQCGRDPSEMSRPFTSTRSGFVLSEGVGIQVVTSASVAFEMGLPIYSVVAMTHMAADKIGRSIPAPGRGILTAAKQAVSVIGHRSVFMDPKTRAKRIRTSLGHVQRQGEADMEEVMMEVEALTSQGFAVSAAETQARIDSIKQAVELEKKRNAPGISPIAGALSVFGLDIQDLTFASFHWTATKLNDVNECSTLDLQLRHLGRHLGRHPGNPVFTIAQQSVVGHGVVASGAWALNGALQAMHSGIIPGNRNADNIDKRLEAFETLLLANQNIALDPEHIKAFTVTSYGFG